MNKATILAAIMMLGLGAQAQTQQVKEFAARLKGKDAALSEVEIKGLERVKVYNISGGGFVVTSTDSRTREILGYSRKDTVTDSQMPDGMRYWLEKWEKQIAELGSTTLAELQAAYRPQGKTSYPDSVSPLITSQWSQSGNGYNSMVPYDPVIAADTNMAHLNGRPTVGCGALAAAQIIRYWRFPEHGYGQHRYSLQSEDNPCWRYGTLQADFANTAYLYDSMPDRLTSTSTPAQVEAVATLMAQCGIACNMSYNSDCHGSSGSTISANQMGLQRYFHYNGDSRVGYLPYTTINNWKEMLKDDLSTGKPVYYCGQSYRNDDEGTVAGGHAFVCDGYDEDDLFHFNWGWGGYCDGYFALTVLRPLTQYNFTSLEYCIFDLHPNNRPTPIMAMADNLQLTRSAFAAGENIEGAYAMTNLGDATLDIYVGANIYSSQGDYMGCVDGRHLVLAPGDTARCHFAYALNLPYGRYSAVMQYSYDSFYAGMPNDITYYLDDLEYNGTTTFEIDDHSTTQLTNLVLCLRFADDDATFCNTQKLENIFNTGYQNVTDYFQAISYGQIDFATKYSYQIQGNDIEPYTDTYNRGYFQPYSPSNPEGYHGRNPMISISTREAKLIERLCRYVDSLGLVPPTTNLDGNGDGDIDNVSIVVKGGTGEWAELLWPHMEYFPHDSIGYTLTINGKRVNTFNFEFEGAPNYFTPRTFCHEMGHSIGLPDLYHYYNYTEVYPVFYDNMAVSFNHPSAIYKHKVLDITGEPTEITQDGTYQINSLASSRDNNLYYIRSSIDTNQWFTIEYRVQDYLYENMPYNGLVMGRWMDTVPIDIQRCGNSGYDGDTKPNTYYVFRPNSDNDMVNGDYYMPFFGSQTAMTTFGPTSNPHPFLADGTPEQSFEIYDIQDNGDVCQFSVRFFRTEGIEAPVVNDIKVYPIPATHIIYLSGVENGTMVRIYNMMGQIAKEVRYCGEGISVEDLSEGMYIVDAGVWGKKKMVKE